jgi:hypothetical protein
MTIDEFHQKIADMAHERMGLERYPDFPPVDFIKRSGRVGSGGWLTSISF